ncbi:LynF/TruF/PatF family peptide O-prenyltransferase [Scytonema sp. PCC 10023]|uniref:LynF/TruF/PatF family peptide O-prenyltransferase n=1 Tax=Scytonema sp. PCC 10023 TaxID=1680591 RepID=UPI0039C723AC
MSTDNNASFDSDNNLYYIGEHKRAFKVEDVYPLDIFEHFVKQAKGWGLECSCKIGKNDLYPIRFNLFYAKPSSEEFNTILDFCRQVEARNDVQLNYQLMQEFLGDNFDFHKVVQILVGVDLRNELSASRLKVWFVIQNYPEKVEKAMALCEPPEELRALIAYLSLMVVGFDFYLDGRSSIELYPRIIQKELQEVDVQKQLSKILSPPALKLLDGCWAFGFGFSKANPETILYYPTPDPNSFIAGLHNHLADRVHAYYREKSVRATIVAFRESELLAGAVQNLSLYYQMSLPFYKLSATYKSLLPN